MSVAPLLPIAPDVSPAAFAPGAGFDIWFNDERFRQADRLALIMSKGRGIIPPHLLGNHEGCLLIIEMAIGWKLSPTAVAHKTYPTGDGRLGFYGSLCQAILEASGEIEGRVRYEPYHDVTLEYLNRAGERVSGHFSTKSVAYKSIVADPAREADIVESWDWDRLRGRFRVEQQRGEMVAFRTWTDEDEAGLGVRVIATLKGDNTPSYIDLDLCQAFPRGSQLWATDPATQLRYLAVRRFANTHAPCAAIALPSTAEESGPVPMPRPFDERPGQARDAEARPPRPTLADFEAANANAPDGDQHGAGMTADDIAAEFAARHFAETGQQADDSETDEKPDEDTAEPVEETPATPGAAAPAVDQPQDAPEAAGVQGVDPAPVPPAPETPPPGERPSAAFWAGDSLHIAPSGSPKDDWYFPNWDDLMRERLGDAQTAAEVDRLVSDNRQTWRLYAMKQSKQHAALQEAFAARAEVLKARA
jgi:hypothetical protein